VFSLCQPQRLTILSLGRILVGLIRHFASNSQVVKLPDFVKKALPSRFGTPARYLPQEYYGAHETSLVSMDDPFKSLIRTLLEREGFWVRTPFKLNLTQADKAVIGRPWPREIAFVAYKAATNELRLVECGPYVDSIGVRFSSFAQSDAPDHYKLFTDANLRSVVTNRVITHLTENGCCLPTPSVTFYFAASKIRNESDRQSLRKHFEENGWVLWDDEWISKVLGEMSKGSGENDAPSAVAKLLLRFFGYEK